MIHSPEIPAQYGNPNVGPDGFRWQPPLQVPAVLPPVITNIEIPAVNVETIEKTNSPDSVTPRGSMFGLSPSTGLDTQAQKLGASGEFDSNREYLQSGDGESQNGDLKFQTDKVNSKSNSL